MTISELRNSLPDGPMRLSNAQVPAALVPTASQAVLVNEDDLALVDIDIRDGMITALGPAGGDLQPASDKADPIVVVDLDRGQVWPCYVDCHTHLDKSHIGARTRNPDGTLGSAIRTERHDQEQHWSENDLQKRMEFALRCAYAHGTRAIRTHLCSGESLRERTWSVFCDLRTDWSDRIDLQAVPILEINDCHGDAGTRLANFGAERGGVLGCAIMGPDQPRLPALLDHLLALATERSLDLDFHADENGDPDSHALREIALAAIRNHFDGNILVGHGCSLAKQAPDEINATLELVADTCISIVSLPLTNMYLQDRSPDSTPRWRGITCLQEMRQRNIDVAFASDNCRDLFNIFGDYDLHQVFSSAVLTGHLDLDLGQWPAAVNLTPAKIMGVPHAAGIEVSTPADLILFAERSFGELVSRSAADRVVLRNGRPIDAKLPDYRDLG